MHVISEFTEIVLNICHKLNVTCQYLHRLSVSQVLLVSGNETHIAMLSRFWM